MKVNFCGPFYDASGYAEFSRYFIYALDKAGVEVSAEPILIDPKKVSYGKKGAVAGKLLRKISYDVNVINMVPTLFRKYKKVGCKNIGFTMWETSRLPDIWIKACNEMDAIFVPCSWNKKVFEDSGVAAPVYVVQPGVEPEFHSRTAKNKDDEFKFYSVFQWIERKNPTGLIRAYLSEFFSHENVSLTIKSYKPSRPSQVTSSIEDEVVKIKKEMNVPLDSLPKIKLITDTLTFDQMNELHASHDCFVLPHRSEGWGFPHMEAMSYGNPVITTNFSGNTDFMNNENSYLVSASQTPVSNISWYVPWCDGRMWWGEPALNEIAAHMRYVVENKEKARDVGLIGKDWIANNFNAINSARQFTDAVQHIMSK